MARVRFTKPAIRDFAEIGSYIAKDNEIAARDFVSRIKEKCYGISDAPYIGRLRDDYGHDVRSFPFSNYVIFYKPISSGIAVLRVIHGARDLTVAFQANRPL